MHAAHTQPPTQTRRHTGTRSPARACAHARTRAYAVAHTHAHAHTRARARARARATKGARRKESALGNNNNKQTIKDNGPGIYGNLGREFSSKDLIP